MTRVPAARCPDCGEVLVPPRPRCPGCGARTEVGDVAGRGTLLTWTVLRAPPEGVEAGRVVGVVGLGEGVRALALGPDEERVPPLGADVVVEEEEGDGRLRFRAAEGSTEPGAEPDGETGGG